MALKVILAMVPAPVTGGVTSGTPDPKIIEAVPATLSNFGNPNSWGRKVPWVNVWTCNLVGSKVRCGSAPLTWSAPVFIFRATLKVWFWVVVRVAGLIVKLTTLAPGVGRGVGVGTGVGVGVGVGVGQAARVKLLDGECPLPTKSPLKSLTK